VRPFTSPSMGEVAPQARVGEHVAAIQPYPAVDAPTAIQGEGNRYSPQNRRSGSESGSGGEPLPPFIASCMNTVSSQRPCL
jgi:hypothetical protein